VSAPVLARDGSVIAAVSVSGPVERLTRHPAKRFGRVVAECAAALGGAFADL
jgi:DNA-binding IclR family transcriptional regulator